MRTPAIRQSAGRVDSNRGVTQTSTSRRRALLPVTAAATASLAVLAGCAGGTAPKPPANVASTCAGTEPSIPTRCVNFHVANPAGAFLRFGTRDNPTRRVQASISHPGISYDTTASHHIQSYTFYDRGKGFHIFDANQTYNGQIYIAEGEKGGTQVTRFNTGFPHPGGMQIIGDYLLVGMEKGNAGAVYMYDLTRVYQHPGSCCGTKKNQPPSNPVNLLNTTGKSSASAVGITNVSASREFSSSDPFKDSYSHGPLSGIRYVMAVHTYGKSVALYISKPGVTLADPSRLDFKQLTSFAATNSYDSMALLSQPDGSVWMMGFRSYYTAHPATFQDYADLWRLTTISSGEVYIINQFVEARNFKTVSGTSGVNGPHFRWGPGLNISGSDRLRLNVPETNWGTAPGRKVTVNWFFNY